MPFSVAYSWAPDADLIAGRRVIHSEIHPAVVICFRKHIGIHNNDISEHAIMNIASKRYDTVVLENNRIRRHRKTA